MMRNILALVLNDLAVALKNKTFYLVLFIPFFVFMTLKLIDQASVEVSQIKIGFIEDYAYAPQLLNNVNAAEKNIAVTWVASEKEGVRLLKEKTLDGVLLGNKKDPERTTLLVLKRESLQTLAIIEVFSALQKAVEGNPSSWISDIETLHAGGVQRQTLPTWILMVVLLVGFLILPAQVAEEKEKKLLLALLQTPISEAQWLIAKVVMGMVLAMIATLFFHLLGGFAVADLFGYIVFIAAGSFCFSAYGIFLGFLCSNQASARTLGVIFYLPHLLPSALSDFSQQLTAVAPFLPSYQFYEPLKSVLLEDGRIASMPFEMIYLWLVGAFTFYLAYVLMKRRWLM
ncbi:MAG: ABC transporter permease [Desulfuromonadales bacterium]